MWAAEDESDFSFLVSPYFISKLITLSDSVDFRLKYGACRDPESLPVRKSKFCAWQVIRGKTLIFLEDFEILKN